MLTPCATARERALLDVLIIGGGNAALCAALMAREAGATVLLLEASPRAWRGGNSVHTRNLRCMHDAPQDVLTEAYPEEEFWQDLLKVTGGQTTESLARRVIRESSTCRTWMQKHGVRFQPSLSGTLHLSRTNAFFMGGGKALVNAYYRSAEALGVQVRYDAPVARLELKPSTLRQAQDKAGAGPAANGPTDHNPAQGVGAREFVAAYLESGERISAKTCIVASGGFESNIAWQREAWGQNAFGEWPADNFAIRGTRFNRGVLLKDLMAQGADTTGDPTQSHCVAIDARAPLYDGGIVTRVDCVSLGIMVNKDAQRFYDEGEDFWPKRYAIWGRLVAQQRGQLGFSIIDAKAVGRFMPPVFKGVQADTLPELARQLGLDAAILVQTVKDYNAACRVGTFNHAVLDDCHTVGLTPAKTHWALPIDTAPFYGYALKPGITFTYLGMKVGENTAIRFAGIESPNLFAAGELMAGNVLGKGYTAGVGMTIGTVFGRIAGVEAAQAAMKVAA
ncbi:MAG: FAD-dependent tricarballylate dehydrogenase TcuA [Burkholderiaceae bacterium]